MILLPDEVQAKVYKSEIEPNLKAGKTLVFSHGFNIHFGQIVPPKDVDVIMIAPKGPGHLVRRVYDRGRGVPVPDRHPAGRDRQGQGDRAGLCEGHRRHPRRRHRDHLRGRDRDRPVRRAGRPLRRPDARWSRPGFETLVEAGYQPEIAYFECLHELKLIVDLMYEGGMSYMRYSHLQHGRVRRPHPRPARHQRRHGARRWRDPRRDPDRRVRPRVDPREQGRPAGLQRAAAQGRST